MAPSPCTALTSISPPCSLMMSWQMLRPRPVPLSDLFGCKHRLEKFFKVFRKDSGSRIGYPNINSIFRARLCLNSQLSLRWAWHQDCY